MSDLSSYIRDIPDFPKEGIIFKDITTLLQNKDAFKEAIEAMASPFKDKKIDIVVGMEARGFIFAPALAYILGAGTGLIRKPGKLPYKTDSVSYDLEYGSNTLEMHIDTIKEGDNVLIADDLLATGGTLGAAIELVEKHGGKIAGITFMIELLFLNGAEKFKDYNLHSIIKY
ncbi:MAG: adenine phosphoribosyltransferase [Nitrospinae bacterium]|nr:adenine phosphoribosyltransferase [Nitrospinota bacterium]